MRIMQRCRPPRFREETESAQPGTLRHATQIVCAELPDRQHATGTDALIYEVEQPYIWGNKMGQLT
jgi:hypothetical protein